MVDDVDAGAGVVAPLDRNLGETDADRPAVAALAGGECEEEEWQQALLTKPNA